MAQRLSARLDEMKAARERDLQATGRELVQDVGAVVAQAFAQAYPDLHTVRYHERPYNVTAFHQGKAAGGRVGLHPGVKRGLRPCNWGRKREAQIGPEPPPLTVRATVWPRDARASALTHDSSSMLAEASSWTGHAQTTALGRASLV